MSGKNGNGSLGKADLELFARMRESVSTYIKDLFDNQVSCITCV